MRTAWSTAFATIVVAACTPTTALAPVESTAAREEPQEPTVIEPTASETTPRAFAFVDPSPPEGWQQCAGFVNTVRDDIDADFFDDCVGAAQLRVRVWTSDNQLEEDVAVVELPTYGPWPSGNYLRGPSAIDRKTHWGGTDGGAPSVFFTTNDGKDACGRPVADGGPTLGSGHAETAIIAPTATGDAEYRRSCGKESLLHRKIALYR